MERKIGEVFECTGIKLCVKESIENCKKCYFYENNIKCSNYRGNIGECKCTRRRGSKNVIFEEVKNMEERTIKLTLEKAKEFYKKGGEFRDLALSAYTKEELEKIELPKTWEGFCESYNTRSNEYFINLRSDIAPVLDEYEREINSDRNILPSEGAAKAHLALMQLHQLRDCYRQGWIPSYNEYSNKYCITRYENKYNIETLIYANRFLSFQSLEIAREFLNNFKDLIIKAGDLI